MTRMVDMNDERILLAHGGGGRLTRELLANEIATRFSHEALAGMPDGATLPSPEGHLVFSTDSYVVQPIEFPGGNIGHLAVHGTVNDISVCGGKPLWLSLGLIVEEGLPLATLRRILDSILDATRDCGVDVVTGDTKVVSKGQCDGLYINTAGIGALLPGFDLSAGRLQEGDPVLVSGTLGDHGLAVMACRENIAIENGPQSDTAPVHRLVAACAGFAKDVHFMRDPTRGGLASVLNEVVEEADVGISIREDAIPLSAGGRAVTEMLGLDPLHVASEGRMALICSANVAGDILAAWREIPEGAGACCIGKVTQDCGRVIMQTLTGGRRLVDVPRGELLPRIC